VLLRDLANETRRFGDLSMTAFWSMMVFLAVLTVGFAYEWKKGALEWE
jgi:NADH-quinone oxidoreductase subunit A